MERQIIAINGTIGSGKDTFGETFINNGYTRMSFATNLKDSVAAIFGWIVKCLRVRLRKVVNSVKSQTSTGARSWGVMMFPSMGITELRY
ncbi:UNVERIFIED_ORG: hypothetical protein [Escherichia phage CMSTMSU]